MADGKPFDWRAHLPVHPAADEYPLMRDVDPAGFAGLVEDIKASGLRTEIVTCDVDGRTVLLDGRNRFDALARLGLLYETDGHLHLKTWTGTKWAELSGDRFLQCRQRRHVHGGDLHALAASLNLHRRHLTPEERRARLEAAIKRNPEKSDRAIAADIGVSHPTIAKARKEVEPTGNGLPVERIGRDGKMRRQPARRERGLHKCWQCGVRAPVGEVQQHKYAAFEEDDVWLHGSCVAAFEAEIERDRQERINFEDCPHCRGTGRILVRGVAEANGPALTVR